MTSAFHCRAFAVALLFAVYAAAQAQGAQGYPNKPIRFVVPFAAGGTTSIIARSIGQKLTEAWGQPVIVDNRAGAGGGVGTEAVARSAPDGYTLLMGTVGTFAINPAVYARLNYDPIKDFILATMVALVPSMLLAHPSVLVASVRELIALAEDKPGQLTYASAGSGTPRICPARCSRAWPEST